MKLGALTNQVILVVACLTSKNVNSFAPPASNTRASISTITTSTRNEQQHYLPPTHLTMANMDEIIFNAQSAASSLASLSLNNSGGNSNPLTSIPIMYGAGLLTSVSPCVWGLLPLTMSYISNAANERQDKDTTLPTLAFAGGLAVVFCSLGLVAATVGGAVFGNSGNTNIILPIISNAICCAMAFQLLDFISIPFLSATSTSLGTIPPVFSNTRNNYIMQSSNNEPILLDATGKILTDNNVNDKNNNNMNGENQSLFRTFLLGGSSALVASPCATPVLTSILAFVANSSNPLLGATLLFFYTLGYSTPLLFVASTGGKALNQLRELGSSSSQTSIYAQIAPWITPLTAGILLWYGTNGLLTAVLGDPSLSGLAPIM